MPMKKTTGIIFKKRRKALFLFRMKNKNFEFFSKKVLTNPEICAILYTKKEKRGKQND